MEAFPPGINGKVLWLWHRKGIRTIGDVYSENILLSFTQIRAQFDLPRTHSFVLLQVLHFIQTYILLPPGGPVVSLFDKCFTEFTKTKGLISYFRHKLESWNVYNIDHVKTVWERELAVKYESDE